jgi:hypothetical protein
LRHQSYHHTAEPNIQSTQAITDIVKHFTAAAGLDTPTFKARVLQAGDITTVAERGADLTQSMN